MLRKCCAHEQSASRAPEDSKVRHVLHPQTFLCYGMNGSDLPVPHGGPVRMRLPRQIGYKNLKFINKLTVLDEAGLKKLGNGCGSIACQYGYAWYTGI